MTPDFDEIAKDWLRALRGRRSQRALSRRLGYRSNIVYRWESGRCFPTAAVAFRCMRRLKVDLRAALARFFHGEPDTVRALDLGTGAGVSALLELLRGPMSIVELSRRAGVNRYAVARWQRGRAEPRLPDFLRLVHASADRLLDFIAAFTPPEQVDAIADAWRALEAARELAYDTPWSHAVLRALDLQQYRALPRHRHGWIAERLSISPHEERRCLDLLLRAGQIRKQGARFVVETASRVDMRADPRRAEQLRAFWIETALDRLRSGSPGVYAYNVFSVSATDLERIRELYRSFHAQMRAIIAASTPEEHVVLWGAQLVALSR
jgi:transcriptional regulator with XRE-family HTH domain